MKKPERHNIGNGAPVLCVAGMCKEDRNMKKLMDLVQELSFVRVGGSEEEKRAAELIMEEINQAAGQGGHPGGIRGIPNSGREGGEMLRDGGRTGDPLRAFSAFGQH